MSGTRLLLAFVALLTVELASAQERRNPFKLPDVSGVEDDGAKAFAAGIQFPKPTEDVNAEPWPTDISRDNPMSLVGTWASRWTNSGTDTWNGPAKARVAKIGKRLFIRYYTGEDPAVGGYLIEAILNKEGLYVGRYSVAGERNSSGFWVGRLVSYERIDGFWTAAGRWDFRRRFE